MRCETAPGGESFARTSGGPRTGVTSFDHPLPQEVGVGALATPARQEGGRDRPSAARSAAVRHTPAVKVPSGPLPKPHCEHGPRLPLRMCWGRSPRLPAAQAGRSCLSRVTRPSVGQAVEPRVRQTLGLHPSGQPRPLATCSDPRCPLAGPKARHRARNHGTRSSDTEEAAFRVWPSSYWSRAHSPEVT